MKHIWVVEYTETNNNNWIALEMHHVIEVARHEMKLLDKNAGFKFRIVKYIPKGEK
jgi:hypothetical protein